MATTTITEYEKKALERKAKAGWASYFCMEAKNNRLQDYISTIRQRNKDLLVKLNNEQHNWGEDELSFLKKQYLELYDELKRFTDCPVCFETLTKETTKLPNCSHQVCISCYERMPDCPICRKKYYKK